MATGECGGSQPHLFECSDGLRYLVKASNNPQGGRVLVNEAVGGLCMDWLGVQHPQATIVNLPADLLASSPGARFSNGLPLAVGLSFGSEYWKSFPQGSIQLDSVSNHDCIAGVYVFDTWIANTDGRQYRTRTFTGTSGQTEYEFFPVDQGHSISHCWTAESLASMSSSVSVAAPLLPLEEAATALYLDRLRCFDSAAAKHVVDQLPERWITLAEREALTDYLVCRAVRTCDTLG
jgi:hypothetical protein